MYPTGGKNGKEKCEVDDEERWNYVERKGMEACILRSETNGKEKRKREWLQWVR